MDPTVLNTRYSLQYKVFESAKSGCCLAIKFVNFAKIRKYQMSLGLCMRHVCKISLYNSKRLLRKWQISSGDIFCHTLCVDTIKMLDCNLGRHSAITQPVDSLKPSRFCFLLPLAFDPPVQ